MFPQSVKDAVKKMPLNRKIDLANAFLDSVLKKRIRKKEEELRSRLDMLEKELNERFDKQLADMLESLLDNLSE